MPSGFLMKITSSEHRTIQSPFAMSIIIRQPYTPLLKEMCKTFRDKEDVTVMVDRRRDQRRRESQPVILERRRADEDRRRPKQEMVEVTLSV